jgi:Ca2+-binding EF-hand superfamily protein
VFIETDQPVAWARLPGLARRYAPATGAAVAAKKGKAGKAQKAGFKAFDIDNDMRLSPAEYKMMAETKPKKYTHQFDQVDADHDGYISIEEYRKSFEKEKPAKGNGKGNKKGGKKKAK